MPREIHKRFSLGYKVWATEVETQHWGGITVFWREEVGWEVERARSFGTIVVYFTVMLGNKYWYVVGAYVPPNDPSEVHHITYAVTWCPAGVGKMLVGNLNACLKHPRNQREEYLVTVIEIHILSYQAWNFTPRQRYQVEETGRGGCGERGSLSPNEGTTY